MEWRALTATQYAVLKQYIKEDKIALLIEPLVHLAQQEETVIRDEAIRSICSSADRAGSQPQDRGACREQNTAKSRPPFIFLKTPYF